MGEELLQIEHVSKRFSGVQALSDVSFKIERGEILGLVGENGSGKSTMIKIISGVYEPDKGDIYIGKHHYKRLIPITSIREGIQVIYQDFLLFPNLSVAENIGINRVIAQRKNIIDWQEIRKKAEEALFRVGVHIPLDTIVEDLSTADRQIVAIARALLEEARLIIMDEPTTALTWREVQQLFHIINGLKKQHISILFVSHKLNEVKEVSDRIMVFRDGKKVLDQEAKDLDVKTIEYYMTGRSISEDFRPFRIQAENIPLLEVKNLSLNHYFINISFKLWHEEVLGITGLLGSGRTELARSLFGELQTDSGEIFIDGKKVSIQNIQDAIALGIGYVPEDRVNEGLFLSQPIINNIAVCTLDDLINRFGVIDFKKKRDLSQEWAERLEIKAASLTDPVNSLSGGNQQRVVLAKWLAKHPKILILNGPTVGVDIGSKVYIHELISSLAQKGIGVILISDDIPELLATCHRILLMKQGKIVKEFLREEVNEQELHQHLVGGE